MRQTAGVTGSRGVHLKPVIEVITVSDSDDEEEEQIDPNPKLVQGGKSR